MHTMQNERDLEESRNISTQAESEFIQESEQRGRDIKSRKALQAGPQKGMVFHFAASTGRFW